MIAKNGGAVDACEQIIKVDHNSCEGHGAGDDHCNHNEIPKKVGSVLIMKSSFMADAIKDGIGAKGRG
jgi:hypothetical protein